MLPCVPMVQKKKESLLTSQLRQEREQLELGGKENLKNGDAKTVRSQTVRCLTIPPFGNEIR